MKIIVAKVVCVCVCACVRVCVRARVCARARVCVRARAQLHSKSICLFVGIDCNQVDYYLLQKVSVRKLL